MIKVRFLSFLAQNAGVKEIDYNEPGQISDVLLLLQKDFPVIADLLEGKTPPLTLILNGKSLYFPLDLQLEATGELIVSPIIAGG